MYNNEKSVAAAIDPSMSDAILTTKLNWNVLGYQETKECFERSWSVLTHKERAIDIYLVHSPMTTSYSSLDDLKQKRLDTWSALEEEYRKVFL